MLQICEYGIVAVPMVASHLTRVRFPLFAPILRKVLLNGRQIGLNPIATGSTPVGRSIRQLSAILKTGEYFESKVVEVIQKRFVTNCGSQNMPQILMHV